MHENNALSLAIVMNKGHLQGLPSGFDLMYLALTDRIMQVRFGLKVVGESWVVGIWPMTLWFG